MTVFRKLVSFDRNKVRITLKFDFDLIYVQITQ